MHPSAVDRHSTPTAAPRRLTQLFATIAKRVEFPPGPLVIALSGGADSAAAAWLLTREGRMARALHVNHSLPHSSRMAEAARGISAKAENGVGGSLDQSGRRQRGRDAHRPLPGPGRPTETRRGGDHRPHRRRSGRNGVAQPAARNRPGRVGGHSPPQRAFSPSPPGGLAFRDP